MNVIEENFVYLKFEVGQILVFFCLNGLKCPSPPIITQLLISMINIH